MENVYNVGDGRIRESDIPEVVKESETSQFWRLGITFGIFTAVCIVFIASLSIRNGCSNINRAVPESVLQISYWDEDPEKSPVWGRHVYVAAPNDIEINYISVFADGMNSEPVMSVLKRGNDGALYTVDLEEDRRINRVAILGSDRPELYSQLTTAKVIIRNDEGRKVWQNCRELSAGKFTIVDM